MQNAKIVTLGERVDDVFVLTDANNHALSDPELCRRLQDTIIETLGNSVQQSDNLKPNQIAI